jgi:hypothetical protein
MALLPGPGPDGGGRRSTGDTIDTIGTIDTESDLSHSGARPTAQL